MELLKDLFKKKAVRIKTIVLASVLALVLLLELGSIIISLSYRTWSPGYEREDISHLLGGTLNDADYDILYRQTGLTRMGIDDLLSDGRADRILEIQDSFFTDDDYEADHFGVFLCAFDRKDAGYYPYPKLRTGDIVCCFSTFFSFFEMGHCGIVMDGERGILAECAGYSTDFKLINASRFFSCPAFVVLRPRCDDETKQNIVEYINEEMLGASYDILAGIFEPKDRMPLRATHCSHAIWYAYNKFGIDIDSNGGKIVTPMDIFLSDKLDIVGARGVDIFEIYR